MSEHNQQGVYKHKTQRPLDNPEIKKDSDWWDDLCKAHGAENLWPNKRKQKKTPTKKKMPNK